MLFRHILTSVVIAGGIVMFTQHASAEEAAGKNEAIAELLRVTGSEEMAGQMIGPVMQMMAPIIRQSNPGVSDELVGEILAAAVGMMEGRMGELMELIAQLYAKHFSVVEIRELTAFYRSPTGRKLIEKQPLIMQESMAVGQAWGQLMVPELTAKIRRILEERNLSVPPEL